MRRLVRSILAGLLGAWLLLALAVTAAWVRSEFAYDRFWMHVGGREFDLYWTKGYIAVEWSKDFPRPVFRNETMQLLPPETGFHHFHGYPVPIGEALPFSYWV